MDRIWFWVYYNKVRIYLIFYLLKGDYSLLGCFLTSLGYYFAYLFGAQVLIGQGRCR